MKNTTKLAIIASGGGMSCAYSAGCVLALIEKFNLIKPRFVIGCSGSAGTLAYYVSGQYSNIKRIWEDALSTKRFINPWRFWRVIDIDFLIDEVFRKQVPLDVEALYNSSTEFLIPYTNIYTGLVEYFTNRAKKNIFEALRAAKAMPLAYRKSVKIENKYYCDTHASSSIAFNIIKAKELGANKILILKNSTNSLLTTVGMKLWAFFRNKNFKNNYYSQLLETGTLEDKNLLIIQPDNKFTAATLNNNEKVIKDSLHQGYHEVSTNKKLEEFLSGVSTEN